jgi:hypothetical protein
MASNFRAFSATFPVLCPSLSPSGGLAGAATTERLRSLGVEHHLAKPVCPVELFKSLGGHRPGPGLTGSSLDRSRGRPRGRGT